tara:strand:- start:760 stop:3024 length:2265 start_codon:yes stop_codon:yes gene_type:complete
MFVHVFRRVSEKKYAFLISFLAIFLLAFQGLNNFRFDASSDSLILENDKSFEIYESINESFGTNEFVVIAVRSDNLFSEEKLTRLKLLEQKIEEIYEVEGVVSVLDVPIFKQPKVSLFKSSSNAKYLLEDSLNLDEAKKELISSPLFSDLVVSKSGDITAFQVNLKQSDDYSLVVKKIRNALDQNSEFELFLAGPAMIIVDTINYIKADVYSFGLLTIVIFSFLLILFFRSYWVSFVIISNASLVVFFTVCMLGINDWPISIVSSNFIALLLISSIAISVHIVVKLQDDIQKNKDQAEAFSNILIPCFYAAITTMVGFASLILSEIKPVIDFGKMMSIGVAINLFVSFLYIPILNAFKPLKSKSKTEVSLLFYKYLILPSKSFFDKYSIKGSLLLLPIFIFSSAQLKVENKFIDYFNSSSEIYQGMSIIDQELGGTTPIDIVLTLPAEEIDFDEDDLFFSEDSEVATYWWREKNMDLLKNIKESLSNITGVGKVMGLANGVEFAENLNNDSPIGEAGLAFLKNSLLDSDEAQDIVLEYLTEDERSTRISLRTIDSLDDLNRNELLDNIENVLNDELNGVDVKYTISGLGVLYNNLLQSLFNSQIKTFGAVFAAIFLMLVILFRSFYVAISILIVPSLSVGTVLSIMSIFSIPLDIMTITIASICIGMSVDYSIHFAWKYLKNKKSKNDFYRLTVLSTGRAILITGITIILGFLVFLLSNFNPTVLFGVLSAIAIFVSMLLSMLTLPRFLNLNTK